MNLRAIGIAGGVVLLAASGCGRFHKSEWRGGDGARAGVRSAAVIPLENLTAVPDAGRLVADVLSTELAARRLLVVDRGRAESSLVSLGIVSGGTVDRLTAQHLGEILEVDAVVFGSVSEAREASPGTGTPRATVGVSLRVVEVKSGTLLLAGSYAASAGDDSITEAARRIASEIGKAVGQ